MADDLRAFAKWTTGGSWPSAPCPTCKIGDLHLSRGSGGESGLTIVQSGESARNSDSPDWDPTWLVGGFHGVLICTRSHCLERVIVTGDWATDMDEDGDWTDFYRLRFAWPALPLMDAPAGTPKKVIERIEEASRVVWADPASAANGLRRAVEEVLNHRRVRKTTLTATRLRP
jgi:hypothetical protein